MCLKPDVFVYHIHFALRSTFIKITFGNNENETHTQRMSLLCVSHKTGFFSPDNRYIVLDIIGCGHMPNEMQNAPFQTSIFSSHINLMCWWFFIHLWYCDIYVIMQQWHPINTKLDKMNSPWSICLQYLANNSFGCLQCWMQKYRII